MAESHQLRRLFGQIDWHVTDGLTIQPGVRLNYDKKDGHYERHVFDGARARSAAVGDRCGQRRAARHLSPRS